jgi:hypothetical protein
VDVTLEEVVVQPGVASFAFLGGEGRSEMELEECCPFFFLFGKVTLLDASSVCVLASVAVVVVVVVVGMRGGVEETPDDGIGPVSFCDGHSC